MEKHSTFVMYLPEGFKRKLDDEATKRNLSRSAVLRLAFDEFLKHQSEKKDEVRDLFRSTAGSRD